LKVVEVENLFIKSKSNKFILEDISFSLEQNQIHAVVGDSGSGKSSFGYFLLNLLSENLQSDYKKFFILGHDGKEISFTTWQKLRGREIFLIPQNPILAFHPYLNIGTQIQDFFRAKNFYFSKEEVMEKFFSLGISEPQKKWDYKPSQISGGERQRILIGLALFSKPKILIADEPTTALDAMNEKKVLEALYKVIVNSQTSVILISHDRRIILEFADEVTVLKNGKFIEKFAIQNNILPLFKSQYTKELLR